MLKITCREIIKATGGRLQTGDPDAVFTGISTDSRSLRPGDLFIPIRGLNYDGHDYIGAAVWSGASGYLTSHTGRSSAHTDVSENGCNASPAAASVVPPAAVPTAAPFATPSATPSEVNAVAIEVDDTLAALGGIAAAYRSHFDPLAIAVTGSVGKTSTKDMVAKVLGKIYCVLKTEGNYNNEIGLPHTIFKLDDSHTAAVFELGMNNPGEIGRLSTIVKPDMAIITNIGMSHIGKLGSRQNILKAKLEILNGLKKDGLVILNGDDGLLGGLKGMLGYRTVTYGIDEGLDCVAYDIRTDGETGVNFAVSYCKKTFECHICSSGVHNVHNALAAIVAGIEAGVPEQFVQSGISEYVPDKMRLNIRSSKGVKVIDDTYNASPNSMEAAILVLKDIKSERRIAVLGDMLELGEWSDQAHFDTGAFICGKGIDYLVTIGNNAVNIARGAIKGGFSPESVFCYDNMEMAKDFLSDFIKCGDTVLIKGSNAMRMNDIAEIF